MRRFGSLLIVTVATLLAGGFFSTGSFSHAAPCPRPDYPMSEEQARRTIPHWSPPEDPADYSDATPDALREKALKLQKDGNYREACTLFYHLALDKEVEIKDFKSTDATHAVECLQRLFSIDEFDAFIEKVIKVHADNPIVLKEAADLYLKVSHSGCIIAGNFYRGNRRGGGRWVNCDERDRIRAVQLMRDAMLLLEKHKDRKGFDDFSKGFYNDFARMFLDGKNYYRRSWPLQYLTDLSKLPDWGERDYYGSSAGAPVDDDGNPIYYTVPKSFDAAENNGQRWRWCLEKAADYPKNAMQQADFFHSQFGVQTMRSYLSGYKRDIEKVITNAASPYAVHTLKDNETIARLADRIRRFTLPEEVNFIKIYHRIADDTSLGTRDRCLAMEKLFTIYENRRQYPKAVVYARKLSKLYKILFDEKEKERKKKEEEEGGRFYNFYEYDVGHWKREVEQIVGNWGQIEPHESKPKGSPAQFEYVYRNGSQVEFTVRKIDMEMILTDIKEGIKDASRSKLSKEKREEIGQLIGRLHFLPGVISYPKNKYYEQYRKYVDRQVQAKWTLKLDPPKDHFNSRVTVSLPTLKPGFYEVRAKMADGNTCWTIAKIQNTVMVKRSLHKQSLYYVADAVSGRPTAGATVEFFGYRLERPADGGLIPDVFYKQFATKTNRNGQIIFNEGEIDPKYLWLAITRSRDGTPAFLGFSYNGFLDKYDRQYHAIRTFVMTDRPVYRPEQTVHYKFWVRNAQYDMGDVSHFAEKEFNLEIYSPRGEKVVEKTVTTDAYGGIEGELDLAKNATLGNWRLYLKRPVKDNRYEEIGRGGFRVEEYKKPEYEVTIDAPKEPIMLGEKINATIRAKYYFGSPVTNARVTYTVKRTTHNATWCPPGRWDWLFGSGYWWFAYNYDWYPGWRVWGFVRPRSSRYFSYNPSEIVMEREVKIGPDGTVSIEIDTTAAKDFFGDKDHRYTITAQVIDQSRRTIVGEGNVLVVREPFKVYTWVDRGYYTTGDTIVADFAARNVAGRGVQGTGEVTLYKVSYDKNGKPSEAKVQSWDLPTKENGTATLKMSASAPGQYRLAYKVTDTKKHTIEGGYVFTVRGRGFDGRGYRFNAIELVPDKKEYKPGEKIHLQINTEQAGSTVLLFLRPTDGVYLKPQMIRLKGKSTVVDVKVEKRDMPNFFIEALTVADGRVHTISREIVVPPEKRILNLDVIPSAKTYRPGEKAKVKLRLTDLDGKPYVGSTVVTIYDKAVEYISGGSNIWDIKEFFWKWRRSHRDYPPANNTSSHLGVASDKQMNSLGIFGYIDHFRKGDGQCWYPYREGRVVLDGNSAFAGLKERPSQKAAAPGGGGGGSHSSSPSYESPMPGKPYVRRDEDNSNRVVDGTKRRIEYNCGGPLIQPKVRSKFADTAFWVGSLETDKDGTAEVKLDMPENLTTWKIRSWAMCQGTRVGEATTEVITRKDLILRLQAPRFFVQSDQVYLSAVVHNYLKTAKKVKIQLELPEDLPAVLKLPVGTKTEGNRLNTTARTVTIQPGGEARIDWPVEVVGEGEAVVRMKALTDEESDAVEQRFPAYVHGMLRTESYSGVLRPEDKKGQLTIRVPEKRRPKLSRLEIRYSPTLAGAMVDALPYLVNYPHGCTEQTLNRFLPTLVTQKVLLESGIDLAAVKKKRTNLNAQEIGDDAERAKQWKRYGRDPVFDEEEVRKMIKESVDRLTSMQRTDGGWGWFYGWRERSWPHTTAQVVHGLQVAKQCDVSQVHCILNRGVTWLTSYQDEQVNMLKNAKKKPEGKPWKEKASNIDAFIYMVLVDAGVKNADMGNFLYRDRTSLSINCLAMLGLAYEKEGDKDKLKMILRNLSQYVVEDDENQTAYLKMPQRCWWCWHGSENEAEAYYLKLLSRTDPKGRLASRLVKYLLNNRKHATYWNSTRDTALCIEAFADYLKATGELKPDMVVDISIDGKIRKTVKITSENLFSFDNRCVLEGPELTAGKHRVTIERTGTGPVYYNAYETNFTLEDFIPKAGLEVRVNRKFYRLIPKHRNVKVAGKHGRGVDQKVEKYVREELKKGATVASGDLIEVELEIDSKNDYEYLIFEDFKAAGFETVDIRSGYTGNDLGAYVEYRDNRVIFFVRRLVRGKHSVSYRLRAEIPGRFSALPTVGSAMYAPELKGNSDEMKIKIKDPSTALEPFPSSQCDPCAAPNAEAAPAK